MKLDFRNIGKGLEAIAQAKRESDYQKALEERKQEWAERERRAALQPEERQGEARFYSLDQQPITEDMVGPQELPSITGRGLTPETYYTLPGEDTRYETRRQAIAARGLAPTAWEKSQAKADIAEEMGLYDRATEMRRQSVEAMQAKAAEYELRSKEAKQNIWSTFTDAGGGAQGAEAVLDYVNQFTANDYSVERTRSGKYRLLQNGEDAGRAPFATADDLALFAMSYMSPDNFQKYAEAQRTAGITARTTAYTQLNDKLDRLADMIGNREKALQNNPAALATDPELQALREDFANATTQLNMLGIDDPMAGIAEVRAEIERRSGGAQPPAPTQEAGAQAGQPQPVYPPSIAERRPDESRFGQAVRQSMQEGSFDAKLNRAQAELYGGSERTPGAGGLRRLYGYFADTPEEERARAMALEAAQWMESAEGRQYFANNPEMLDAIINGDIDALDIYDIAATPPQRKANGGLIYGYADGSPGGIIAKAKESMAYINDPKERAAQIKQAKKNADEVAAKNKESKETQKEKMAAIATMGEGLSPQGGGIGAGYEPGYSDFGDSLGMLTSSRVRTPEYAPVDPNEYLRYYQQRRGGGLIYDYRRGGKTADKGTETSDSILARVSKNEYVVNAESMKIPGVPELLEHINKMGLQKRKAKTKKA